MLVLYNLAIALYTLGIRIAALFQPKAKLWVKGRKNLFKNLEERINNTASSGPLVWIHCASLGEFEQGRPIIELLKEKNPDIQILLSFFSPSGYEIRKNYPLADHIFYLPSDSASHAKRFIAICKPQLAIFVKYEFWYHYLNTLFRNKIPTLLVAARFRPGQVFFKWYGALFRRLLFGFDWIFLQDKASATLLSAQGLDHFSINGDPRIDRVLQIAEQAKSFPIIEAFTKNRKTLIVGSSWPPDEQLLAACVEEYVKKDWKFIFAPHEIGKRHIQQLQGIIPLPTLKYSEASIDNYEAYSILIIDNIGMLSSLYKYGHIAYIGGGFGAGIHNTLEPIAFGLPVIFGPKYQKFEEAVYLVEQQGGFSIQNIEMLQETLAALQEDEFHTQASSVALNYLDENKGASIQIVEYIEQRILRNKLER